MKWGRIAIVILLIAGAAWFVRYILTPLPGTRMDDMGREHVTAEVVSATIYNSNPPTSGPHLATWVGPGIYTEPQQEGELIHSLEHGYIVLHYATSSADLAPQLEQIARKKGLKKLIVVPRVGLDTPIAVTAWNYIDKMSAVDAPRIERFIDFYRDHGPEQTME